MKPTREMEGSIVCSMCGEPVNQYGLIWILERKVSAPYKYECEQCGEDITLENVPSEDKFAVSGCSCKTISLFNDNMNAVLRWDPVIDKKRYLVCEKCGTEIFDKYVDDDDEDTDSTS